MGKITHCPEEGELKFDDDFDDFDDDYLGCDDFGVPIFDDDEDSDLGLNDYEMCDDGYGPGSFYDEEDDYGIGFPFYDEEGMDDDGYGPGSFYDEEDIPEAVYDPYLDDTKMDEEY